MKPNYAMYAGMTEHEYVYAPVPLGRTFFRLFTREIKSTIANNLKPIGMMKTQSVTIYPNIYECVSDYMKIHHDRFLTFYEHCERSKIA